LEQEPPIGRAAVVTSLARQARAVKSSILASYLIYFTVFYRIRKKKFVLEKGIAG